MTHLKLRIDSGDVKLAAFLVVLLAALPAAFARTPERPARPAPAKAQAPVRRTGQAPSRSTRVRIDPLADGVKYASYLGGASRRTYGIGAAPDRLQVLWRARMGSGRTYDDVKKRTVTWSGTGWTGQPVVVQERGRAYLVVGAYDHGLRRIDMRTGSTVWRTEYDDVIKGTAAVFENPRPSGPDDRIVVVAGSRRGYPLSMDATGVAPLRAVSFTTGKELWRLPVPHTVCYSRDADSSGLLANGSYYAVAESGYVYRLDPSRTDALGAYRTPTVLARSRELWDEADIDAHRVAGMEGSNLVVEASPALVGDRLYVAAGSGHVYGLDADTLKVEWDFKTGTDMDGTTVPTRDGGLFVSLERQFVPGRGGVFYLDPSEPAAEAVRWWFPTQNRAFGDWQGGVIGSVVVNDESGPKGAPPLAAFTAIDGNLYVVSQDELSGETEAGPDAVTSYPTPARVAKLPMGGSISTPLFVGDRIVSAGFDGKVRVFAVSYSADGAGTALKGRDGKTWRVSVKQVASYQAPSGIESTPLVWRGRVYVGCRDGYLYCLGDSRKPYDDGGAEAAYRD